MECPLFVNEADGVTLLRYVASGRGGQFKSRRPGHENCCSSSVTEQGVGENQAQIIAHLKNRTADFHGYAHHHPSIRHEQGLRHLEIGYSSSAAAPNQIVHPDAAGKAKPLNEIGRYAGTDITGTGVNDEPRHVPDAHTRLVQSLDYSLSGELDRFTGEARYLLVG